MRELILVAIIMYAANGIAHVAHSRDWAEREFEERFDRSIAEYAGEFEER